MLAAESTILPLYPSSCITFLVFVNILYLILFEFTLINFSHYNIFLFQLLPINYCSHSCGSCQKNHNQKNFNTVFLPQSCINFYASSELFTNNLDYQRDYISKHFQCSPNYNVLNFISEDGDTFPYATLTNNVDKDIFLNDSPQPNFIRTDIGYVPILFDNCRNITNVHKVRTQNSVKKKQITSVMSFRRLF